MTNKEIELAFNGLVGLRERATVRFPASTAYAITRNIKILQPIVSDIFGARMEVLQEYGDPVEEQPGFYKPKPGKDKEMNKAITDLDNVENEITLHKVSLDVLEGVELSLEDMDALFFMVDG